ATTTATGCTNSMTSSVTVSVNPLPAAYTVTGGGTYCAGTSGVHIGLTNSASGITYQLYNGSAVGAAVPGTGAAMDFGSYTSAGSYSVIAADAVTGCGNVMTGTATIN